MNKPSFEQLIEYVINNEDAKAAELFHKIVVDKSRAIYEGLMDEDDAMGRMDQYDESMGGDQADDLIDDIEAEEQGMQEGEEGDEEMPAMDMEMGGEEEAEEGDEEEAEEELEDRVVDLEDKLDELMAEFEAMMGGDEAEAEGDDMTDMEIDNDEMETEEFAPMAMEEGVDLKAAPKPVTAEEGGTNTKSTVAANSGAKGMDASPVKMTGDTAQGRTAPTAKDMGMTTSPKQAAAPKPTTAQASGVNNTSPTPKH